MCVFVCVVVGGGVVGGDSQLDRAAEVLTQVQDDPLASLTLPTSRVWICSVSARFFTFVLFSWVRMLSMRSAGQRDYRVRSC